MKVNFTDLPKWKRHKGATPSICDKVMVAKLLVHDSTAVEDELAKATVQKVLLETVRDNKMEANSLAFTFGPTAVWAAKALKKGEMKSFPAGTVSRIKDGKTKGKLIAVFAGKHFAISNFKAAQDFSEERGVLDAFHWVKQITEADEANLEEKTQVIDHVQLPFSPTPRH